MSAFLAFESFLLPLGSSILDVHSTLKAALTGRGWRVVKEDTAATPMQLFVIPPVTEAIGDARIREVLLIETGGNFITFRPVSEALQGVPQIVSHWPKAAGAAGYAVTLGSVTVAQDPATVNAANTKEQNLRYLFEALAVSADPVIAGFTWEYQAPAVQNADDTNHYLFGVAKTPAPDVVVTPNANLNAITLGKYAAPGLQNPAVAPYTNPATITTDLVSGFVYYLQVNARGLALATKTNTAYFGPIHACWGDHARALASVPATKFPELVSPVELLVGYDADSDNLQAIARVAKIPTLCTGLTQYPLVPTTNDSYPGSPFGRAILRHRFHDCATGVGVSYADFPFYIAGSGLWKGNSGVGNDFQIHRAQMAGNEAWDHADPSGRRYTRVIPAIQIGDWYKFRGTATDEALQLVADTVQAATLAQAMDAVTEYPSLALDSTANLAPAGFLVIEGEAIHYTGISGTTVTGVTRARYGTVKAKHFPSVETYQGLWFTKINGGALFCGFTKPV